MAKGKKKTKPTKKGSEAFSKQTQKVGKKKLAGRNQTKSSYSAKRITLPKQHAIDDRKSQFTTHSRNLDLPDLLSQLRHATSTVRKQALSGLLELLDLHPHLLAPHLGKILDSLVGLGVDPSPQVRTELRRLLRFVLLGGSSSEQTKNLTGASVNLTGPLIVHAQTLRLLAKSSLSHVSEEVKRDGARLLQLFFSVDLGPLLFFSPHTAKNFVDLLIMLGGGGVEGNSRAGSSLPARTCVGLLRDVLRCCSGRSLFSPSSVGGGESKDHDVVQALSLRDLASRGENRLEQRRRQEAGEEEGGEKRFLGLVRVMLRAWTGSLTDSETALTSLSAREEVCELLSWLLNSSSESSGGGSPRRGCWEKKLLEVAKTPLKQLARDFPLSRAGPPRVNRVFYQKLVDGVNLKLAWLLLLLGGDASESRVVDVLTGGMLGPLCSSTEQLDFFFEGVVSELSPSGAAQIFSAIGDRQLVAQTGNCSPDFLQRCIRPVGRLILSDEADGEKKIRFLLVKQLESWPMVFAQLLFQITSQQGGKTTDEELSTALSDLLLFFVHFAHSPKLFHTGIQKKLLPLLCASSQPHPLTALSPEQQHLLFSRLLPCFDNALLAHEKVTERLLTSIWSSTTSPSLRCSALEVLVHKLVAHAVMTTEQQSVEQSSGEGGSGAGCSPSISTGEKNFSTGGDGVAATRVLLALVVESGAEAATIVMGGMKALVGEREAQAGLIDLCERAEKLYENDAKGLGNVAGFRRAVLVL